MMDAGSKSVGNWLDVRLGFRESMLPMLTHPIPGGRPGRWAGGTSSAAPR